MVRALVIDVDGVIVGKKHGVNFPLPSAEVINVLKMLQRKGLPVILCTAKFNYAVKEIIIQAELRNPHITDGGALIIDPLDNKVIKQHVFEKSLARTIIEQATAHGFYTEVYGVNEYYLQKDHIGEFTNKRIKILQKEQITVTSLAEKIDDIEVIKILLFSHTRQDKEEIDKLLEKFDGKIHRIWSQHPTTIPSQSVVITINGVSKKDATLEVLEYLNISPDEALGVGDTKGDWNFMSICRYAGVVGDESDELKELAKTKGEGNYFLAPPADENGFLQIIDYFIK